MADCNDGCGPKHFTTLTALAQQQTLTAKLGCLADSVRDLNTVFGQRPYTVSLVHTRWTGGVRNEGAEEVLDVVPLLPTPKVTGLDAMLYRQETVGRIEEGDVRVTQISPSMTEDQLNGLGPNGEPIPDDQCFYYEVGFLQADGTTIRRRYTNAVPVYQPEKLGWVVTLHRLLADRQRDGTPAHDE